MTREPAGTADATTGESSAEQSPARTAAAAARRARRIGGRPSPGPTTATAPDVPVDKPVTKPASTPEPEAEAADTDSADEPTVVTQVPRWLLWTPAAVLAAVAIVFAVVIGVQAHGVWYAKASANSVRDEVLAAAKTCTAATNSYKYTTIAADERAGLKCTTGAWTTNYRRAMEQVLTPSSKTLKSTQVTQINAAGVQSVDANGTEWKVLVFGQASVTSINQKTARPDPFSAVVTMRKSGGVWKIADIDQVLKPIKSSGS